MDAVIENYFEDDNSKLGEYNYELLIFVTFILPFSYLN